MEDEAIPNITCFVCGENEFEQRDGYYYCLECGTKQEQVQHVEVEKEDDAFNETTTTKHVKSMKINVAKAEKPQLTSWECYNYILRGYVEELLSFGAKEELKLMALQVWAAYLRRMEVAFFNKKQADLPKLGVRYLKNDAETIYNHTRHKRKRKRKDTNNDTSCTSGEEMSTRSWRKTKRKLNESIYSSATSATSASTSINSNKAIKLNYNMKARKILKKKMSVKHLLRHEEDTEGVLKCHKQPRTVDLKRLEYSVMLMSIKQVYTVLAIALNLIGDDIQMTDFLRFVCEGHIGWKNILQYFPENIAANGPEMLEKIEFYRYSEKYTEKLFRRHIGLFSKSIGIKKFHTPDIIALVQRYTTELCLPPEIRVYAERLINFLPPRFDMRSASSYPAYEARAMAYIIFVMKLLFGLDGHKEHRMSKAAKKMNQKIMELNYTNSENRPLLFVWDEWLQYIEMRKVIVSRYNPAFCKQFKQCESTAQILNQMSDDLMKREDQEHNRNDKNEHAIIKQRMDSFKALFETFMENFKKTSEENPALNETVTEPKIEFQVTLTPALSYFKTILLHYDKQNLLSNCNENYPKIPQFMRTDHTRRDMQSYLQVRPIWEYFQNNQKELRVTSLGATANRNFVGIFRAPRQFLRHSRKQIVNFEISDAEWMEKVAKEMVVNTDDLEWNTQFEICPEDRSKKKNMCSNFAAINIVGTDARTTLKIPKTSASYSEQQANTNPSINVFSENNMDPLNMENGTIEPRRNLGSFDIFADIEDEEYLYNGNGDNANINDTISSRPSSPSADSMPTNVAGDIYIKSEFIPEASNAEPDIIKFYTSNMDCWMIFGNILMLSKPQIAQLQDKLPLGFFWLMQTCAQTIGMDWEKVYEQLLVIETMLCLGIEDLDNVTDCVYLKYTNPIKDYQKVINSLREIW